MKIYELIESLEKETFQHPVIPIRELGNFQTIRPVLFHNSYKI